ncbi:MAG: sigma 54-interacting transcriptional regulator [Planctomycetaceae bacterium]
MAKRSRRRRLETRLLAATTPVFLLDGRRRLIFFNEGSEALTGWKAVDLLGGVCDYATPASSNDGDSFRTALAPPPEVIAEGRSLTVPANLPHKDGGTLPRLIHFHPLEQAAGDEGLVLGVIAEIEAAPPRRPPTAAQILHAELSALRIALRRRFGTSSIIAKTPTMLRVAEQISVASGSGVAVLLTGEPGTGKEHVARVIHDESAAGRRSFVPLDCRLLPARELRNTLRRVLDVDDPSELPPGLQPATIFLQSVEHLARDAQQLLVDAFRDPGHETRSLRLMAGTDSDLQRAVGDDRLRHDFYCLLTPLEIALPPLRDRKEELESLAQYFLEELNRVAERQLGGFSDEVWEQIHLYNWPGNLDELRAVVEEAAGACDGTIIDVRHLPFRFRTGFDAQFVGPPVVAPGLPLDEYLKAMEADRIRAVLEQVRHNKTQAAKVLGMTRPRLYRRMEALGIADEEGPAG